MSWSTGPSSFSRQAVGRVETEAGSAAFLWSEVFRHGGYGSQHPLAVPRVPLTHDLIDAYGGFQEGEVVDARRAGIEALAAFHARDYVSAYEWAEKAGSVAPAVRERFQLGTLENPYFEGFFSIPATAAGASVQGAELVLQGRPAFNPAGGMHHARPAAARGFCFLNDPALAIFRLRAAGRRVMYVDIDAHHGDGVEEAFRDDPHVLTLSLHMGTDYAYPFTGGRFNDQGSAAGGYSSINIPLPREVHDAEYHLLFDAVWMPALERFRPDAVVLQAGSDALFCDPLAKLRLTTQGFLRVVDTIRTSAPRHPDGAPRLLVLGGGGYHPLATARAWCGIWSLLCGRRFPEAIPGAGRARLNAVQWTLDEDEPYFPRLLSHRLDEPMILPVRDEIRRLAEIVPSHAFLASKWN